MKIKVYHSYLGECWLTNEHSASSCGQPVLVAEDGLAYGPGDYFRQKTIGSGYIQRADMPLIDSADDWVDYTTEELAWVDKLAIESTVGGLSGTLVDGSAFRFGASFRNGKQTAEIDRRLGGQASGKR